MSVRISDAMGIIEELRQNDFSNFTSLYESSKKSVFYSIFLIVKSKEVSEDLMQETYMDFLENVKKIKDDVDPVAWLTKTAKYKALNYYKKNKKLIEDGESNIEFSTSYDKYIDTGLIKKVRGFLPKKECEIFLLRVLGEYSFKEISHITKIPVGTLTWMYQETREKLKDLFEDVNL